jgi:hypothetical protein
MVELPGAEKGRVLSVRHASCSFKIRVYSKNNFYSFRSGSVMPVSGILELTEADKRLNTILELKLKTLATGRLDAATTKVS